MIPECACGCGRPIVTWGFLLPHPSWGIGKGPLDFASLACLAIWARRELVEAPSEVRA